MTKQKFKTKLEKLGSWTIAIAPIDVKKVFGTGAHVRVKGIINSIALAEISLMPMGNNKHCLPIKAQIRRGHCRN